MFKVDILLPTFNGEKFLEEQINSLLNQTYSNINIIIRDDGSNDNTIDIINKFAKLDNRIIFNLDVKSNLGLVSNISFLLGLSSSDFIMYCDQDDVWLENKVETLMNEMLKREELYGKNTPLLVHSDCYVTDSRLNIKCRFKGNRPLIYGLEKALFKFSVQGASSLFNKALKKEMMPFVNNVYVHDRYTQLCAEIKGYRFYINKPLMYYRQHRSNLIGSRDFIEKLKNNFLGEGFVFFHNLERKLMESLLTEKYPENHIIKAYLKLTSEETSLFEKIKIIWVYKISMRLKEYIIMVLKM